jgi:hypothetical protein
LLDEDDEQPATAAKKRSGETSGALIIMAAGKLARPIRRAFRLARDILIRRDELLAAAFDPPDPCNPFAPAWQQPYTEDHPAFAGNFEDDRPPPNWPSANL